MGCDSSPGFDPCNVEIGKVPGQALAERGHELVYGRTGVVGWGELLISSLRVVAVLSG